MSKGFFYVPIPKNETILSYAPGTPERDCLQAKLKELHSSSIDLPMIINGQEVTTDKKVRISPPHEIAHTLGHYFEGDESHVKLAINAALAAKKRWSAMSWEHRAAIFLKAADLLCGPYRMKINAATMLAQSKNAFQAEIDAACELADFFRFGVHCVSQIYKMQPESARGMWNYNEFRPLEGFVFALTPFNFTSIAGNLPVAPAMMGNTCVWKSSKTAAYSAAVIMEILQEAGLPDGVINLVYVPGPTAADVILRHPSFAGIHFTGSTAVFRSIWKTIGENISTYKSYPRIVGETGGKDFIFADPTAPPKALATAIIRGSFEYQGQKCSAASRVYIPSNIWDETRQYIEADLKEIKMGPPEDFTNFVNAVIDEASFDKLSSYIENAKQDKDAEIICGGNCDKSVGYYIEPTVILARKPDYVTMIEELFGPVVTIYVYDEDQMDETLNILNNTSMYALTGAIFSSNRYNIEKMTRKLEHAAGNFYINDKPTAAVVGQQPFGGSRGSGTDDKAGSIFNFLRWTSIRTIKETFVSPTNYMYPSFLPDKK